MPKLLVSVKNTDEALIALAGGADLIDVKDPARGSLGRADPSVLADVLDVVAGQRPVSAALGELRDWSEELPPLIDRLAFVKWGLANASADWRSRVSNLRQRIESTTPCRVVLAGYADHRRAGAPAPGEVAQVAIADRHAVLLLDTCCKDGPTLLDWLTIPALAEMVESCQRAGVAVALAGGLQARHIAPLRPLGPDWFAVRGAVCAHDRKGTIKSHLVRDMRTQLPAG
jgi:hypothetical protein